MAEVKQSLQKTASKEQENYKSVFLKKRSLCNRQSVYISGEIQKRIMQIVGVITNKQVSIGSFIDNVLEEHLNTYSRFANFANQVERICRLNNHQSDKWLSGREVCALLGISIRSLQNYRDSGKLCYSQIGNKLYYKSADIERLVAECTVNHVSEKKNNYIPTNK